MSPPKVGGPVVSPVPPPSPQPIDPPGQAPVQPPAAGAGDGFERSRPDYAQKLGGQRLADAGDADQTAKAQKVTAPLSKEDTERGKLIDHMARGNTPPLTADEKSHLMSAFKSFSVDQMKQADKTGLRIWRGTDAPPEYLEKGIKVRTLTSRAEYVPGARVLQMNPDRPPPVSELTHELGHLRDDMLDDPKGLKPILEYPESKRSEMLTQSMEMSSTDTRTHEVKIPGEKKPQKLTVTQMYDAYVKRSDGYLHDDLFHSPTQSNTYARKDAQEFFGEAFAVFHGGDPAMQAKLREQAPEMYAFLKADAKANGVPVPDEKALDAAAPK